MPRGVKRFFDRAIALFDTWVMENSAASPAMAGMIVSTTPPMVRLAMAAYLARFKGLAGAAPRGSHPVSVRMNARTCGGPHLQDCPEEALGVSPTGLQSQFARVHGYLRRTRGWPSTRERTKPGVHTPRVPDLESV